MATQTQTQQQTTGASNLEYDIVAEMHELLQGNEALQQYIQDARSAGDQEAERCFQEIQDQNRKSVGALRSLLHKCIQNTMRAGQS